MRRALTAEQTRTLEVAAMEALGVSLDGLMERVGLEVADLARKLAPEGPVVVLAGSGNNAGDGWVAARALHEAGREVSLLAVVPPETLPEPALKAARAALAAGVPVGEADLSGAATAFSTASLVVDAMLGMGARGPLREPFTTLATALNASQVQVLSVDLPSGVESDTGRAAGVAVVADHTLVPLCLKIAHVQEPARTFSGEIHLTLLGADPGLATVADSVEVWEAVDVARCLSPPSPLDHKGSRGRVAIVGGSPGMTGAVVLAAWGSLRAGAGYVTCGVPESLVDVVDAGIVPAVVRGLPETTDGRLAHSDPTSILETLGRTDAIVVGPGLGTGEEAASLTRLIMSECQVPLVIDADALRFLDTNSGGRSRASAQRVLTPHPGEAARMLGLDIAEVQADRLAAARSLAAGGDVCVLKGACTLVASLDRVAAIPRGSAALATMGTGDVLAGVIGTMLSQGLDSFDAACAGVFVHGVAGEVAGAILSEAGTTAIDVVDSIPEALSRVWASEL